MNMPVPPTVLVIDREKQIRRFLRAAFELEDFVMYEAATAAAGIIVATLKSPRLVVLDLDLPDMDGGEVVERLRSWSNMSIIILSARSEEDEIVRLLNLGADDYVVKPFGVGELIARAHAALRRNPSALFNKPVVQIGSLSIDLDARLVSMDGRRLSLSPKEYRLLKVLMLNAGKVVTHRHLLKEVWGSTHVDSTEYLRIIISKLRKKIEPDPMRPRMLETELGVGYRLNQPGQVADPKTSAQ